MSSHQSETVAEQLREAMEAHALWKLRLARAIASGQMTFDPEVVEKEDRCPFGSWMCSPCIPSTVRDNPFYTEARGLHAEFHKCAASILRSIDKGNIEGAKATLKGRYEELSDQLYRVLVKWRLEEMSDSATVNRVEAIIG